MRKKIRNSLSAKVFLWVFAMLTICSMLIYGIVMAVIPQRYQIASDGQIESNANKLFSDLEKSSYDEAIKKIYNFCIENNTAATMIGEGESLSFGELNADEMELATANYTSNIKFVGDSKEYTLVLSSVSKTSNEIFNLFIKLIPAILGMIILISALSAFICSKVIVKPILKISYISKRMAELDMTWECEVKSSDEIGVLSSSLNTMAERLQNAMGELENANVMLKADVEKMKQLEEQRRNFFAAVSHELKTPLTILKGQLENMILGYGDYKNYEKYLPQALKATENIEYLVMEILSITKMETMDLNSTLKQYSFSPLLSDVIKDIEPLAEEKEIQIHQNIEEEINVRVNKNMFTKALSNVIGNAVRHSPRREEVFITLERNEDKYTLVVENTGVSIPEDELQYMFTPFHRTDKSRSKATGGSGLGLYIVKTILDLHEMTYKIKNTEKGVAFYLIYRT